MWNNLAFCNIHSIVRMFFLRIQSVKMNFSKWMFLKFLNRFFWFIIFYKNMYVFYNNIGIDIGVKNHSKAIQKSIIQKSSKSQTI